MDNSKLKKLYKISKNIAEKFYGGKCLSKKYLGSNKEHKFFCNKHGIFFLPASRITSSKRWCQICGEESRRKKRSKKLKDYIQAAKLNGGTFMYEGIDLTKLRVTNKYKWKCQLGHVFNMSLEKVQNNQWCSICCLGKEERICKAFFEQIFKRKFAKEKPNWLVNENNNRLELDGYNKDLNLAFEYHGRQHRERVELFQTQKEFNNRKKTDLLKSKLCKKNGVKLVVIYDNENIFDRNNPYKFLDKLRKYKIKIPSKLPDKIDLSNAYSPQLKKEIDDFVKLHKGIVIQYPNTINHIAKLSCGNKEHKGVSNQWTTLKKRGSVCRTCTNIEKKEKLRIKNENYIKEYLNKNSHKLIGEFKTRRVKFKILCPDKKIKSISLKSLREWSAKKKCLNCGNKLSKIEKLSSSL